MREPIEIGPFGAMLICALATIAALYSLCCVLEFVGRFAR